MAVHTRAPAVLRAVFFAVDRPVAAIQYSPAGSIAPNHTSTLEILRHTHEVHPLRVPPDGGASA
jgi:hypothetical protein